MFKVYATQQYYRNNEFRHFMIVFRHLNGKFVWEFFLKKSIEI